MATDELMAAVYEELRALAAHALREERRNHTLQPTALVHEAYLRLAAIDRMQWKDRQHFLIAASGTIRRVLIDHARARLADKRGAGAARVALTGLASEPGLDGVDAVALDDALVRLAEMDARKCRVVELRFFGGLTIDETAGALGVGTTTVEDDWAFARAWLRREIGEVQA